MPNHKRKKHHKTDREDIDNPEIIQGNPSEIPGLQEMMDAFRESDPDIHSIVIVYDNGRGGVDTAISPRINEDDS